MIWLLVCYELQLWIKLICILFKCMINNKIAGIHIMLRVKSSTITCPMCNKGKAITDAESGEIMLS